jgi:HPt (histidine-containing phosphotransfer) domain-containing protein
MSDEIDAATFTELQETVGAEFVRELVDTFLVEAPTLLAEMRAALGVRDAERFRRAAHSLKSNGHTFGALAFGGMARELELSGLGTNTQEGALDALEAAYTRAASALKDLSHV